MDLDTTSTWGSLLREATQTLEAAAVPAPRRAASWLLGDVLGCSPAHLVAYADRPATPAQAQALAALVARCLRREPVQYILGYADFYGLRLRVTPDVLIPRPETEQVVEAALEMLAERVRPRVLDVGTGSGCIALALKHERPDADVFACDLSEAALRIARANAEAHHLAVALARADVLASDFSHPVPGPFDLIISNPPYIADNEAETLEPEVRDYEPHLALFAGDDPLRYYRALADQAPVLLAPGGLLVFETHAYHADAVCNLLVEAGFLGVHLKRDLAGHPRIVTARRAAG